MDEQISTPYVDWEYVLMGPDGPWDGGFQRRADYPPVGEWHIEFQGRTRGNELLLVRYYPSDDEDAREWLQAFESESAPPAPVSIDTYFGPTDEPEKPLDDSDETEDDPDEAENDSAHPGADLVDVGHAIHIGQGRAMWHKNEVIITIPPEVFRDAAGSLLLGYRSKYEHIEQRIFAIFAKLSPTGLSDFWNGFDRPVYPNDVFSWNDECRDAFWRDRLIRFERRAHYDCLQLLHSASGEVVEYAKLIQALRCDGFSGTFQHLKVPEDLRVCISHLRSSLKAVDCSCALFNVAGLGYRLIPSR